MLEEMGGGVGFSLSRVRLASLSSNDSRSSTFARRCSRSWLCNWRSARVVLYDLSSFLIEANSWL